MKVLIYILISYLKLCCCSDFRNLDEHVMNQFDRPPWEKNPLEYDLNEQGNLVLDFLSSSPQHTEKNTDSSEHTCTLSYSPEHNYLIREVTEGSNLVWRCSNDFKFAKTVNVVQKNGLTQLVSVKSEHLQSFFKRYKSKFVKVSDLATFTKLRESLEQPDVFLDKCVELDLSNSVPPASFFSTDLVYLDGVPKFTVRTLKHLDLYRVYDSNNRVNHTFSTLGDDTLWKSENNSKCDYLTMYVFDQFVLLHLTVSKLENGSSKQEQKYFKKESGVWHSFGKNEFHFKFDNLKSKVENKEVSLDLNLSKKMEDAFYRKQKKLPQEPELTLYPRTGFHLKNLLYNGTQVSVLGENERFSPVKLYMDKKNVVLVRAHVWQNKTELKNLNFKKTDSGFVSVDSKSFDSALSEFRSQKTDEDETVVDLSSESEDDDEEEEEEEESDDEGEEDDEVEDMEDTKVEDKVKSEDKESREKDNVKGEPKKEKKAEARLDSVHLKQPKVDEKTRVKFNVLFNVDEKYFRQQKSMDGEFEVHSVTPKDNFLVNLVDSKHGVVWKAVDERIQVRSLVVYFKEERSHALKLYVVGPSVNKYKYYMFSNNKWSNVSLNGFYKGLNKDEQSFQLLD